MGADAAGVEASHVLTWIQGAIACCCCASALVAAADSAHALSVTSDAEGIEVAAAAGEQNRLRVVRARNEVRVEDTGAPVAAGPGCRQTSSSTAVCALDARPPNSPFDNYTLVVALGDRDDTATFDAGSGDVAAVLRGEDGADRLHATGSVGADLYGGAGADQLEGGAGADHLDGGNGPDVVVGGRGRDVAIYARDPFSGERRPTPVFVSLDGRSGDGAAGEGDKVSADVEGILSESFRGDVLIGNRRSNWLTGGGRLSGLGGNDRLFGYGGRDRISGGDGADLVRDGGGGRDALYGGAGDDTIEAVDRDEAEAGESRGRIDPTRDWVHCGPGRDIAVVDSADRVARDCERVKVRRS